MFIDGIDEIDNKIVNALLQNARLSYTEIGEQIGISRVSVKNRITALEEKGIIQGYKVIINPANTPYGRRFFLDVITESDRFDEVVDSIVKHPIIKRAYAVTGESRLRAEGYTTSENRYQMFIQTIRSTVDGIKTMIIRDAQYTIKDVDGGVEYVRLSERVDETEKTNTQK